MTPDKASFRIKIVYNKRAISFRNIPVEIEGSYPNIHWYLVNEKGVRLMIRQFLKSFEKEIYQTQFEFRHYKRGDELQVYFDNLKDADFQRVNNNLLNAFKNGNEYQDVNTEHLMVRINVEKLTCFNSLGEKGKNTPVGGIKFGDDKKLPFPKFSKTEPEPEPKPEPKSNPPTTPIGNKTLKSATILWHEGGNGESYDGRTFYKWNNLQAALRDIGTPDGGGYNKVKIEFHWNNGKKMVDRVDLSEKQYDFNPAQQFIGDFLKGQDQAAYESNIENRKEDVLWEDGEPRKYGQSSERVYTEDEMIAYYGPDWRNSDAIDEFGWVPEMDELLGKPLSIDTWNTIIGPERSCDIVIKSGAMFTLGIAATTEAVLDLVEWKTKEELESIHDALFIVNTEEASRLALQIAEYLHRNK